MERRHRLCSYASMRRKSANSSFTPAIWEWNSESEFKGVQSSSAWTVYRNPYRRRKSMNRKMVRTVTLGTFVFVAVLCVSRPGPAADTKAPYPSMAPLDQYLMDRDAEIALARS